MNLLENFFCGFRRPHIKLVAAGGLLLVVLYFLRRKPTRRPSTETGTRAVDKKKVTVDKEFWRQLKSLLKIVIPGATSKEFLLLAFHTAFLVVRTWLSIIVAQMDGEIVKTIVSRNPAAFTRSMVKWLALGIPATYTNSMIRYLESKLAIAFRTRMVDHSYKVCFFFFGFLIVSPLTVFACLFFTVFPLSPSPANRCSCGFSSLRFTWKTRPTIGSEILTVAWPTLINASLKISQNFAACSPTCTPSSPSRFSMSL